ncbi:MAG: 4-(cytidine 5'-diphospho)-2-C-methyl-D-erythritol kinase [Pseudomonadota bacterium]
MAALALWHTAYAPAKLNRFLHITGRRANGYHNLQSLMVKVGLFDVLHFRPRNDGVIRLLNPQSGISAHKDLVVRAAQLLQAASPLSSAIGVDILLDKHIPIGAGLGGGSSDAASTLLTLNRLWGLELSMTALAKLGLQLGADIPFFIEGGSSAWVEGIGDEITPIKLPAPAAYCLMHPPVHVSTAIVYNDPNLRRSDTPLEINSLNEMAGWDNAMEATARQLFPTLNQYAGVFSEWAQQIGWALPRMSGSGACFFIPLEENDWVKSLGTEEALDQALIFFKERLPSLPLPRFWLVPPL